MELQPKITASPVWRGFRFDKGTEALFNDYLFQTNVKLFRRLMISVGIMDIGFIAALKYFSSRYQVPVTSTSWICLTVLLFLAPTGVLLSYSSGFRKRWQSIVGTGNIIVAWLAISAVVELPIDRGRYAITGIVLSIIMAYGLCRLKLWPSIFTGAIMTVVITIHLFAFNLFPAHYRPQIVMYLIMANCMGMLIAYSIEKSQREAFSALKLAEDQFYRAEELLRNILPGIIADRLKGDKSQIADSVESATVMFADLVGFTSMSSEMSAEEIVAILDKMFRRIDGIMEQHGIEKIKTIGDSYMAAAGTVDGIEDHACAMVKASLQILDAVKDISNEVGTELHIRIGLNTGPVVAGVIGNKRMLYDLWGDTVNVASRMESHGKAGAIHITKSVADALGDRFQLSEFKNIEVKGKGSMTSCFVEQEKAAA